MVEGWQSAEVASPCVDLCVIHRESGYCMGCYRTGDEISRWRVMEPEDRLALKAKLPERAVFVRGVRRGGRKGRK